jgi:hypothetical protein
VGHIYIYIYIYIYSPNETNPVEKMTTEIKVAKGMDSEKDQTESSSLTGKAASKLGIKEMAPNESAYAFSFNGG